MCSCHCWMGCWICRGSISQQSGLACPTSQVFTSSGNWNRGVIDLILDVSDQTQFLESVCNRFSLRMLWQRQLTAGYGLTFGRWPAGCPNRALVDQPCASCATCYAICVLRSTRTRSICAMHSIRASQVLRLHSSSFASNIWLDMKYTSWNVVNPMAYHSHDPNLVAAGVFSRWEGSFDFLCWGLCPAFRCGNWWLLGHLWSQSHWGLLGSGWGVGFWAWCCNFYPCLKFMKNLETAGAIKQGKFLQVSKTQ